MTPQEALREIESKVYRNTDDFEMTISKDCYKTIVNALKKQIPKRCKEFKDVCNCGYGVFPHMKSCSQCGQALDWSD